MNHIFCWIAIVSALICTTQRLMGPVGMVHKALAIVIVVPGALVVGCIWLYAWASFFEKIGWLK